MKKVLALVLAVFMIAALTPIALAADATVTVSVSVDGKLEVAAQPVTVSDLTVDAVLKAAHAQYFSDGEGGYAAGIDPTWNMFLITKTWGVTATPYVIVNGIPLGSAGNTATADVATVKTGDNIVISTSSDPAVPATAVSLTADVADNNATVTALSWTLDFATFQYNSVPLAGSAVVDPATGASLGTTDADGKIVVPATGVAAIDGLAAIPVDGSSNSTSSAAPAPAPAAPAPAAPAPAAPAPAAETSEEGVTVYFSVSLEGVLQVAAQPLVINTLSADGVLKAAHEKFFPDGAAGYEAGIDPTFGMYMIQKAWGVQSIPFVIVNGAPMGAGENTAYITVDSMPIKAGDNIILVVAAAGAGSTPPVALTKADDGSIKAIEWKFDSTTYTYSDAPYADAEIVDAQSGDVLGKTDALGNCKLKSEPACGVAAIAGLSAIAVGTDIQPFTPVSDKYVPPAKDYSVFGGPDGQLLLIIVICGGGAAIPLFFVVLHAQRKELKNHGAKYVDPVVGKKK